MAVINCPHCERGQVQPDDPSLTRCSACGRAPEGWVLETLEEIASLPDVLGSHACEECGHPQMSRLPDGTFRCPDCGEEILSLDATLSLWEFRQKGEAYRRDWLDSYLRVRLLNEAS